MLRRLLVNSSLVVLAVAAFSGYQPAAQSRLQADEIYDRGTTRQPFSFDDDDCGFTVHVQGRLRESYVLHTVPGSSGEAFREERRYDYRKVITNPATGKTMSVSGHGEYRELRATHVEGDRWELLSVESGRPFVVRDANGRVVLADRGAMFVRSVQDTLGDGLPSSEETRHDLVNTWGHFPSLADDFDYCALVSRLTR
jgi:hypothetical protein